MKTILETFGTPRVTGNMLADKRYALGDIPMVLPDAIFGIELEIEGWGGFGPIDGFHLENDGSLRNNGVEVISNPTKSKFMQKLLEGAVKSYGLNAGNYSERCSTHVHMNAQDMTLDQLKVMALVYQTVERLLFDWVGNERKDNIFCVPWYESGITANFIDKITANGPRVIKQWVKYSCVNLLPLTSYGTVEFRHLHGTCDVPLIVQWINFLSCLRKFAVEHAYEELKLSVLDMNTVSNYDMFLHTIFADHMPVLTQLPDYKDSLAIGVIDTKLMLMKEKEQPKAPWDVPFEEILRFREDGNDNEDEPADPDRPQRPAQRFIWDGGLAAGGVVNAMEAQIPMPAMARNVAPRPRRGVAHPPPQIQVQHQGGLVIHNNVAPHLSEVYLANGWTSIGIGKFAKREIV